MRVARMVYRGTLLLLIISAGSLLTLLFQRGTLPRRGLTSRVTCWWHRRVIAALGIQLRVHGTPCDAATLFIANHVSWLDIHVIGATLPVRFLSKDEVRHWPLFGWLASRAGTLYIPRGGRDAAANANRIMQNALQDDQHVALFPESTTSDGNIKRFHSRLLQSAIDASCKVQPVAIRYPDNAGSPVHAHVLYVGDTSLLQSLKNIISSKGLCAELHFLDAIDTRDQSRDALAKHAEHQVRARLQMGA